MKNAVKMLEALRYKLRMFGVPIEGPTNIFSDNGAVCANMTRPALTLAKEHHIALLTAGRMLQLKRSECQRSTHRQTCLTFSRRL
jgi:hypothetical protein